MIGLLNSQQGTVFIEPRKKGKKIPIYPSDYQQIPDKDNQANNKNKISLEKNLNFLFI